MFLNTNDHQFIIINNNYKFDNTLSDPGKLYSCGPCN